MGIQTSRHLDRKPTKTKSNLTDKVAISEQIAQFASQLNHLVSIDLNNQQDKLDFIVFKKIPVTGKFSPYPLCSNISHASDSVFVCYDCSSDPHAYLCESCFEKANHEGHRFSVFPNNAGWTQLYCRCGDYQFMNKNTICQKHKQIKLMPKVAIDEKDKKKFSLYFHQIFKTIFSLLSKKRGAGLLNALLMYLEKGTQSNLIFSKMVCEFLLEKNSIDGECSNLGKLIKMTSISNTNFFRNLNFATEYKMDILREMILALNQEPNNVKNLSELIINFAGSMNYLDQLAQENLILGFKCEDQIKCSSFSFFYRKIILQKFNINQIWNCIIRKKLVKNFINQDVVISKLISFLYQNKDKEKENLFSFLEQLLECSIFQSKSYVISCLMIITSECFILNKSHKETGFDKKIQVLFAQYYQKIFAALSTNNCAEEAFEQYFLLLPFFSFGESAINSFWEEMDRRINIFQKFKQKAIIKQSSSNCFNFLTKILQTFFNWDHIVARWADKDKLKTFSLDKKLIDKLLKENFAKQKKFPRKKMLQIIDVYTQKQRGLAADSIKKYLRFNTRKQKYYYVGDKIENNLYDYVSLNVNAPFKFSQWQQFISKQFFTDSLYKTIPKLIQISQRGLMDDIEMVKLVSNVSIALTLINKSQKKTLKDATRTFIKQIPDVNQNVYYILAQIRDRMGLDIDDLEESGIKGRKKPKLDLIAQIRDKKYKAMKQKQDNILNQWLKKAEKSDLDQSLQKVEENICHICKEKETKTNRFVFLANFTRNNVVSTLLKSQVTDLDINICLHKIHEQCYEKVTQKRKCPVCKFQVNCYIPQKPLPDESYTKNWLRNFQNIVTTINFESGKSFNSDWATIFLTYLVFSRSFKVLLKSTEVQTKQLQKIDNLLMLHYQNQLDKWPELTKQALKKAEKTVKGQVRRQSNIKKAVKSLSLDLILQEIAQEPFKNQKRIQKKIRELVNFIGQKNSEKVCEGFLFCRNKDFVKQILSQSISSENHHQELFAIREFPKDASKYLEKTSIKCPMCGKYQTSTWECLFCSKISCQNCISARNHCQRDHRGSSIFLFLNNAEYRLIHQNRDVEKDSLYRNEYSEGWTRDQKPEGWVCCTEEIYVFFDLILHSLTIEKNQNFDNDSEPGLQFGFGGGWNNTTNLFSNNFNRLQDDNLEEQQEQNQEYQFGTVY